MPSFVLNDASTTPVPQVAAALVIDEDGDLVLTLDGIPILFVGRGSGILHPYHVYEDEKNALAARGISFTGDYITTN